MKLFLFLFMASFHIAFLDSVSFNSNLKQVESNLENDKKDLKEQKQIGLWNLTKNQFDQIKELNKLQYLPPKEGQQIEINTSPEAFNIDKFLKEFEDYDCNRGFEEISGKEKIDEECLNKVQKMIFDPLSDLDKNKEEIFSYLNTNIYKPLALKYKEQDSLSGLLNDLMHSPQQENMVKKINFSTDYGVFENFLRNQFKNIVDDSKSMDQNKDSIGKGIQKILQSFHLYWNTLRSQNEIDKARVDTKELMRSILEIYGEKERSFFDITNVMLSQIKKAYFKFMKAHQGLIMFQKYGQNIITDLLSKRYVNFINKLGKEQISPIQYVHEIKHLLDLGQAYNLTIAINKKNENIQMLFEKFVLNMIKNSYNYEIKNLEENNKKQIRDFTVILLLKLQHLHYITFKYHSVSDIINREQYMIEVQKDITVKLYYVLMDNMILIPRNCKTSENLKMCVLNKMNKVLSQIAQRFGLKRTISGWKIMDYITVLFKKFFKNVDPFIWQNYNLFKSYYYQNLFRLILTYKEYFSIKETEEITLLENMIVNIFENFKKSIADQNFDFGLIQQLDLDFYMFFLDLKAQYDEQSPLFNKPVIISRIHNQIFDFIKNFEINYNSKINSDFFGLLTKIRNVIDEWKKNILYKNQYVPETFPHILQNQYFMKKKYSQQKPTFQKINQNQIIDNTNQDLYNTIVQQKIIQEFKNKDLNTDIIKDLNKDDQNKNSFFTEKLSDSNIINKNYNENQPKINETQQNLNQSGIQEKSEKAIKINEVTEKKDHVINESKVVESQSKIEPTQIEEQNQQNNSTEQQNQEQNEPKNQELNESENQEQNEQVTQEQNESETQEHNEPETLEQTEPSNLEQTEPVNQEQNQSEIQQNSQNESINLPPEGQQNTQNETEKSNIIPNPQLELDNASGTNQENNSSIKRKLTEDYTKIDFLPRKDIDLKELLEESLAKQPNTIDQEVQLQPNIDQGTLGGFQNY